MQFPGRHRNTSRAAYCPYRFYRSGDSACRSCNRCRHRARPSCAQDYRLRRRDKRSCVTWNIRAPRPVRYVLFVVHVFRHAQVEVVLEEGHELAEDFARPVVFGNRGSRARIGVNRPSGISRLDDERADSAFAGMLDRVRRTQVGRAELDRHADYLAEPVDDHTRVPFVRDRIVRADSGQRIEADVDAVALSQVVAQQLRMIGNEITGDAFLRRARMIARAVILHGSLLGGSSVFRNLKRGGRQQFL